ncbi:MAG TPA: hypothetical protein DEP13_11110, partial [Gammaproteobacteria bacterium]|nr:hypothetical protein [Gammaproteobacteria bacterium]
LFALCAAVGFLLHWAIFIPSFLFQTEHYFDLTGGVSYLCTVGLALIAYPGMDARGTLLCFMVAIWSARLGTFLFLRVKRAGQDRRFNEIKKKFFRFAFTWTLGGGWVFITMAAALAAITSEQQQSLGILAYLGTLVWLVGFGIEVVADRQKTNFRKDPANAEQFITTGLWSKSRHPNYFGEIVLWFGVALIALPALSGWQLVTLISPLFVTFLLIKVSGVRMLEEGAQKRWGKDPSFQQYVASTPVLVPKLG